MPTLSDPQLETPSRWRVLRETRFAGEILAWAWKWPRFGRAQLGSGEPVLVVPGFGAGDPWTAGLRTYLKAVGFDAHGWGLGRNRGNVGALMPQVSSQIQALAESSGRKVRLVGWSLGGILAREAARQAPERIERIVTLGSPIIGGPRYTVYARSFERRGFDLDAIEAKLEARNRLPIEVPVIAIYSRSDGVVAWQACIDRQEGRSEPVEVRSSHLGLVVRPGVLEAVARSLVDEVPNRVSEAVSSST